MNQILSTENNYKQKKPRNNSELLDMRKIIIVFSALILILALVIIGAKTYGIIKEKSKDKQDPIQLLNKPNIKVTKVENQCILNIEYDEGIEKISYWWNDGDVKIKNVNGSTKQMFSIDIPTGDYNTLHVTASGTDGSLSELKQEFTVEGIERGKPKISWTYNKETTEITIVASSENGIKSLTYQWEGEEEKTISAAENNQKQLSVTILAKRGINSIRITATDRQGNIQEKNETINGILRPEIQMRLENGNMLKISIKHDMGFKKVRIKINGQEQIYDENTPQYSKDITELNIGVEAPVGRLDVEVWVYTLEQPEEEYYDHKWAEVQP